MQTDASSSAARAENGGLPAEALQEPLNAAGDQEQGGVGVLPRPGDEAAEELPLSRLCGFLILQYVGLFANFGAAVNFFVTGCFRLGSWMVAPLLLSGAIYSFAARIFPIDHLQERFPLMQRWLPPKGQAPLQGKAWYIQLFWMLPLGLLQGVIVLLALDEFHGRRRARWSGQTARVAIEQGAPRQRAWNKYHCRAVIGIFEGLSCMTVVRIAYWCIDFPKDDPIMVRSWPHERKILGIVGWISLLTTGLALLELDYNNSATVANFMGYSFKGACYLLFHYVFRTTEVCARVSMLAGFTVTMMKYVWWWWVPLAVDVIGTWAALVFHGGAEQNFLLQILFSIPCVFANLFLFVESPFRRRAARKLSRCFTIKFVFEIIALPLFAVIGAGPQIWSVLQSHLGMTWILSTMMLATFAAYCLIGCCLAAFSKQPKCLFGIEHVLGKINETDWFTACERGETECVQSLIRSLGAEVEDSASNTSLNLDRRDLDGNTGLLLAAWGNHADTCKLLKRHGASEKVGWSRGKPSGGTTCLAEGLGQDKIAQYEWTPVHAAAWKGHKEIVNALLPSKTKAEYRDKQGNTPLHVAVWAGKLETAKLLLEKNRDWSKADNDDLQRPLQMAADGPERERFAGIFSEDQTLAPKRQNSEPAAGSDTLNYATNGEASAQGHTAATQEGLRTLTLPHSPGLCSYIVANCGGTLAQLTTWNDDRNDNQLSKKDIVFIDENANPITSDCDFHLARINSGSVGEVYRAKNKRTNKQYAVKVFKVLGTQQRHQRHYTVQREKNVATQIKAEPHPCLVQLYAIFCDQNDRYQLVMELGVHDLEQCLKAMNRGRTKTDTWDVPERWLDWLGQILLGVEHFHWKVGLVLGDLKPANILLDGNNYCKLTDFGDCRKLRHDTSSSSTWSYGSSPSPSSALGGCTAGFGAPELYEEDQEWDQRADVYSLGGIAWLFFTGGDYRPAHFFPPMKQIHGVHRTDADAFLKHVLTGSPEFLLPAPTETTDLPAGIVFVPPGTTCAKCSRKQWKLFLDGETHCCQTCWNKCHPTAPPDPALVRYWEPQCDWTPAHDFVYKLVQKNPKERLSASEVRNEPLLRDLGLPRVGASPDEVEFWLSERRRLSERPAGQS